MSSLHLLDENETGRERVYQRLKKAILTGEIQPNDRIVETKFAQIFGVSRTPVREAIRMLERDGLVRYEPRKGAVARPVLTREEMDEVYLIRQALELLSVENTVRFVTDRDIEEMHRLNPLCREALDRGDSESYFSYLDQFNKLMIRCSHMPLLITLFNSIEAYNPATTFLNGANSNLRYFAVNSTERRYEAVSEHEAITSALEQRDPDAFRAALQNHMKNVRAAALHSYDEWAGRQQAES